MFRSRQFHCQLLLFINKKIKFEASKCLTTQVVLTHKIDKPPNITAIIDAADICGFPPEKMNSLYQSNPEAFISSPKQWSGLLSVLFSYGFSVNNILNIISQCPELLRAKEDNILHNLERWRNCQFGEKLLISLLSQNPQLINIDRKIDIVKRVGILSSYLEGKKRVGKGIAIAPSIVFENWTTLFNKLEFLHSLYKDPSEIVATGVLKFDLNFIKIRHEFLIRAGLYKMPKKDYRKCLDKNPNLNSIVNTPNKVFANKIAGLTLLEYEVFKDIYDLELSNVDEISDSDFESDSE
uniref:Uncharacterized protein n=1 Tax=Clastoptera arizonana TaxID=38151 RepID=A0A1B6BZZ1_9HEMI